MLYELTAQYYLADLRWISDLRGIYCFQPVADDYYRRHSFRYANNEDGGSCPVPFGKEVRSGERSGGCLYILMNVLWIFLGGIWICLSHLGFGVLLCITVIGIPFGMQHFKLAALALAPFGKDIVES